MTDTLREDIENLREVVGSQSRLGHPMTLVPNDVLVRILAAFANPDPALQWALEVLHADAHDDSRDPMWRYGVRHALAVIEHALQIPARPALPSDPDPNAIEIAPRTALHHGLYLRGISSEREAAE